MADFSKLHKLVDEHLGQEPVEERLARQRERLAASPARARVRFVRATWLVAVPAASLLVLICWRIPAWTSAEPTIASTAPEKFTWLHAAADAKGSERVQLSGGATIDLSPGSRARAQEVGSSEYHVAVESGKLRVEVDPARRSRWSFFAGAYRVDVVGTIFEVEYMPDAGQISVAVERGSVRVSGGKLERRSVLLGAGHRFAADNARLQLETQHAAEGDRADPALTEAGASVASKAQPKPAPQSWQELYKDGKYGEALARARSDGFEQLVSTSSLPVLDELADTARLAGDATAAARALRELRRRFAGSAPAGRAAFLLGRLDADFRSDYNGAAKWFRIYLNEQPGGAYAQEARGRLIVAYQRSGRLTLARATAAEYIRRHPGGPYGKLARSLER